MCMYVFLGMFVYRHTHTFHKVVTHQVRHPSNHTQPVPPPPEHTCSPFISLICLGWKPPVSAHSFRRVFVSWSALHAGLLHVHSFAFAFFYLLFDPCLPLEHDSGNKAPHLDPLSVSLSRVAKWWKISGKFLESFHGNFNTGILGIYNAWEKMFWEVKRSVQYSVGCQHFICTFSGMRAKSRAAWWSFLNKQDLWNRGNVAATKAHLNISHWKGSLSSLRPCHRLQKRSNRCWQRQLPLKEPRLSLAICSQKSATGSWRSSCRNWWQFEQTRGPLTQSLIFRLSTAAAGGTNTDMPHQSPQGKGTVRQ